MAGRISGILQRLLAERKVTRIRSDKKLVLKEIEGAEHDLSRARVTYSEEDYKWATIPAYYCMFHSARALLYSKGFREKSHRALLIAIGELFGKTGEIENSLIQAFEEAIGLREQADYGLIFSENSAETILHDAEKFLEHAKRILHLS
jgi:uncharacterized protein (UPF0332 family)